MFGIGRNKIVNAYSTNYLTDEVYMYENRTSLSYPFIINVGSW